MDKFSLHVIKILQSYWLRDVTAATFVSETIMWEFDFYLRDLIVLFQ